MSESVAKSNAIDVTIRCAKESDAPFLAKLRYDFRSEVGQISESEDAFVRRCGVWMAQRLRQDDLWRCWVVEKNEQLMGHLWLQLIEKIPNPNSEPEYHGYFTNFYVSESVRGRGIGSLLLSAALTWCQTRQIHAAVLWPTERSRSLYQRHGFAVPEDLMELHLSAADPDHAE